MSPPPPSLNMKQFKGPPPKKDEANKMDCTLEIKVETQIKRLLP